MPEYSLNPPYGGFASLPPAKPAPQPYQPQKVTLTNPSLPGWLTNQSAGQNLKDTYSQLGQFYDTKPLENAFNAYRGNEMARYEMGVNAQANAAQNRAMLSGGRVGSSFSKGALMLGAMGQGNDMAYKYAQLAAQMAAQRAQQQGQLAGAIGDYGQRRQGLINDYLRGQQGYNLQVQLANNNAALDAARLAQQGSQYDRNYDIQRGQYDLQRDAYLRQSAQQDKEWAAKNAGPGIFNFITDNLGRPMTTADAVQYGRYQDWQRAGGGMGGGMNGLNVSFGGGGRGRGYGGYGPSAQSSPAARQARDPNQDAIDYWMQNQARLRGNDYTDNQDAFQSGLIQNA